jgi:hypothetical protein
VLAQVVDAGAHAPSFARAAQDLRHRAGRDIAVKQVERLTRQVGGERVAERTAALAAWRGRPLIGKHPVPEGAAPPDRAVVAMDGGRLQIRTAPGSGAAARGGAAGTRSRHGREDKVGCLLSRAGAATGADPCPETPAVFVTPERAWLLAQGIGRCAVPEGEPPPGEAAAPAGPRPGRPAVVQRVVVASRQDIEGFGPQLARAAWGRGFLGAARQAFVADGAAANGTAWRRWFPRFVPVIDFLRVLSYVFAAARAGRSFAEGWPVYRGWIQALWSGDVEAVRAGLAARQAEAGPPAPGAGETSPARLVHDALTYVTNHGEEMR